MTDPPRVGKHDEEKDRGPIAGSGRTMRQALVEAVEALAADSSSPRLDAELLMSSALGIEREELLLSDLTRETPASFENLLARRAAGEPIAYILGRRAFWTIELEVGPGVLVPRPDSETLIEAAVAHFGDGAPGRLLDLGTGSGALLLAALYQWPGARGLGIDLSPAALAIAAANAERLGLAGRAEFRRGDWAAGVDGPFDLILCNPPYIKEDALLPRDVREWEPAEALFAGPDGLDCYRCLAPQIARLLGDGGIACVELGAGQAELVSPLFEAHELRCAFRHDLAGHLRCLILTR
jgi:release factor glutamine methyltransferase